VAVELINAIYNNLGKEMVVNTRNNGAIHGLDDDAVVETNSIIDAQGHGRWPLARCRRR
jgi:6-phospho-beta-glucosidase